MMRICDALRDESGQFWPTAGASWSEGRYTDTLYNHVAPPDWSGPDCSVSNPFGNPGDIAGGAISARSNHPGGVNLLLMDGSVRFVKQGIALPAWRALASRAGGDVAAIDP